MLYCFILTICYFSEVLFGVDRSTWVTGVVDEDTSCTAVYQLLHVSQIHLPPALWLHRGEERVNDNHSWKHYSYQKSEIWLDGASWLRKFTFKRNGVALENFKCGILE